MANQNGTDEHLQRLLNVARDKTLAVNKPLPEDTPTVYGYDFDQGVNYDKIFKTYGAIGFQAAHLAKAISSINAMIDSRLTPVPEEVRANHYNGCISEGRSLRNCTVFLGYTSNMASAGTRDIIRYLAKHNMVDCLVTTAGGIEEDFMKCLTPFYHGEFTLKGSELYSKSINRTGNLLVPNNCYITFHDFLNPVLISMMEEQKQGKEWTPCEFIWKMGEAIADERSIYYWAWRHKIPVFSPAITDGAVGDVLYYHRHQYPETGVRLDIVKDIQRVNDMAVMAVNTGHLILGGGLAKHHILNANTFRGGANFSVFVNTGAEFDGSDAGASPDEAKSWGKVHSDATPVKVVADASLVLPILVGETFAKRQKEFEAFNETLSEMKS